MDPIRNPYAPGADSPPPELADRSAIRRDVDIRLQRLRLGRPAKSVMLVGLRGVGKTVLLDQLRRDAEAAGIQTVCIEAPENRSLPALLAPTLRLALLHLSKKEATKDYAIRGLRALAGFASKLKVTYADIEVELDYEPEPGLADNGDLEGDLTTLLQQVGLAAKAAGTAIVIFIDELQYVEEPQMAALVEICAIPRSQSPPISAGAPKNAKGFRNCLCQNS
jgi:hypothetical protein